MLITGTGKGENMLEFRCMLHVAKNLKCDFTNLVMMTDTGSKKVVLNAICELVGFFLS